MMMTFDVGGHLSLLLVLLVFILAETLLQLAMAEWGECEWDLVAEKKKLRLLRPLPELPDPEVVVWKLPSWVARKEAVTEAFSVCVEFPR